MATTINKIMLVGLQAAYDAMAAHDENKLYFCSDTRNIYKGSDLYTDGIRAVTTLPTTPAVGVLYHNTTDDTLQYHNGTAWVVVRPVIAKTITSASTDNQLVTAKAVYDYVTSAIEDVTGSGAVVQNVAAGSAAGKLAVTTGGASAEVTVPGVVTTPSYDATTRTIVLPVSDGDPITIALGKDIFVDSTKDNKYNETTGNIELYLNDDTKIEIPASGLIDVYTGAASTTATATVSDDNVITVAVKLSSNANNALTIDTVNGGLLVDLSNYALKTYVDDAVADVDSDLTALTTRVDTAEAAITTLNGDSTTVGSVAYAVAQLNTTLTTKINAAQSAADAAQQTADGNTTSITALTTRVTALEDAFGFGTF